MLNLSTFVLVALSLIQIMVREVECDLECGLLSSTGRILNISIHSKRNQTGEWVTTFSAQKDSDGIPNDINLDVTHKFAECAGKHTVHIQGVIKESRMEDQREKLFFHSNCGTNARILDGGRSVEKIDLNEGLKGVALTNRPLTINELFEVRLDKKLTIHSESIAIGVTTHSPADLQIPHHANYLKSGTWMMYMGHIYQNGTTIKNNYMKNPKDLNIGERVGIMRKKPGNLHIFVNGVDQGPAASNVPNPVYGIFELYYNTAKVTIIGDFQND